MTEPRPPAAVVEVPAPARVPAPDRPRPGTIPAGPRGPVDGGADWLRVLLRSRRAEWS